MRVLFSAAILLSLAACGPDGPPEAAVAAEQAEPAPRAVDLPAQPADGAGMPEPMLMQLGEMGGAAEAAVELCGMEHDSGGAKRQQQEQFIQMGGTRDQFEASYQSGYDRVKTEYQSASASQRQAMCDELREFEAAAASGDW